MRHGAGGLSDDVGVSGVGLGLAGVQVRDAAHRQARQVADQNAGGLGHGDRQGADGGGLVHDQQQGPVFARLSMIARSFASSWGSALSSSFLPFLSKATAWWLVLPTSTPMKTSTDSWFLITHNLQNSGPI